MLDMMDGIWMSLKDLKRMVSQEQLSKIWAAVEKKAPCPGPVDCSSITVVATDYKGMLLAVDVL